MRSTSMNRAIGFSMGSFTCFPLSAGCSSERLACTDELKRVNGLTTDVVHAGQQLILPSPISINISP